MTAGIQTIALRWWPSSSNTLLVYAVRLLWMMADESIPASRQWHVAGGLQTHCLFMQCVFYALQLINEKRFTYRNWADVTEHKCPSMEKQQKLTLVSRIIIKHTNTSCFYKSTAAAMQQNTICMDEWPFFWSGESWQWCISSPLQRLHRTREAISPHRQWLLSVCKLTRQKWIRWKYWTSVISILIIIIIRIIMLTKCTGIQKIIASESSTCGNSYRIFW